MAENEFKCAECDRVFYSEESFNQHNEAKHGKKEEKSEKKSSGGRGIGRKVYILAAVVIIIIGVALAMSIEGPSYEIKTPDEDHVLGDPNALVTMTEFSDFQCPFCARFAEETKPSISANYIENGTMKMIFKHYILPSHTNAQKAAEASECAADIGGESAFWEMHDKMFQNNGLLTVSNLKKYARETGLNSTEFDACLDSGVMRARVQKDMNEGTQLGVTGTPAFFMTGVTSSAGKITGACPYSSFSRAIDAQIAGKSWSQVLNTCTINVS